MPKVSILMNCYNGDRYLKEAIDSIYAQTFLDWKIIFIDNFSTDNSKLIAKSYDEKLEYYQTDKHLSFGEARQFGLSKCDGQFVCFLDVDDVYHNDTIEILLGHIEGSKYSLVYGGHNNIDSSGNLIGKYIPKCKSGHIFPDLLKQFDIPTASTIIDLTHLRESKLFYDPNIVVSAEYCLFLQFSIDYMLKSIGGCLVSYRVHSGSLTTSKLDYLYSDRIYVLKKIISKNNSLESKYLKEFKEAFARADYYKSRSLVSKSKISEARQIMRTHAFGGVKYFLAYIILLLPGFIRNKIFLMKYSK